jgi:type IV pilus assembly protein PilA
MSRRRRFRSSNARGFTLIELMITVVIVTILAGVATYGVSKYIAASKTGEAVQLIGSIKAAQESYKDETFEYLDVSGSKAVTNYYPTNSSPGQRKVQWGGAPDDIANRWRTLGVNPSGPVLFVYACAAGGPTDSVAALETMTVGNWPTGAQGTPWYVVQAKADLDAGGNLTMYAVGSFTTQVFSANDGQ